MSPWVQDREMKLIALNLNKPDWVNEVHSEIEQKWTFDKF